MAGGALALLLCAAASPAGLGAASSTSADPRCPPARWPARVRVGVYVNDVQSIDLKLHSYAVDLYLWFRWADPCLDPGETVEFTNPSELWGHALKKNYEAPVAQPSGELYQVLRVQGRFSRKFPLYNYPFDRPELVVSFEDAVHEASRLIYLPDESGVSLNPELSIPGLLFERPRLEARDFAYPTNFGDLRQTRKNIFSRVRAVLPVHRPPGTYAVKLLLPVLCVMLCAALMLLLRPSYVDARIGIGITSLLTIVALQITTNEELPEVDYLVLMDKVYILAYLFVIAGLAVVVRTTRLVEGELSRAERLQRRGLWALSLSFALGMLYLVGSAMLAG